MADAEGRTQGDPDFDPRDVVTPHAFEVDDALLGTPLAAPWQRLVSFLIDLGIAGVIANVAGALVGLPVAYVFYRVATRTPLDAWWKRLGRRLGAGLGAILLFALSIALVENAQEWGAPGPGLRAVVPGVEPAPEQTTAPPDTAAPPVSGPDVREDRPPSAGRLPDERAPQAAAARLRRYAAAVAARDSAALDSLTPAVQSLVAEERLAALKAQVAALTRENAERLREQVGEPSLWRMARATANDLGITVGWVGLYFTLFLAWWGGQTPGKSLLGLRVVRLSGEPITLWYAFERFGGYAAGLATGLFGFAQLIWDPNRQAIHDRVARTVVIQTGTDAPDEAPEPAA
jgi:uncharacterized RDD family membrane protein YckC